MADTLKLDVIVDDHGALQVLKSVDDGVNKVKASAAQTGLSTAQLNAQFDAMRGRLDVLATRSLPATGAGLLSVTALGGLAVGAFTMFAATVRQAAADADQLTVAADALQAPVTRIQQITEAASQSGVAFEPMISALSRLQARIGAGGLNADLEALGINLHAFRDADIVEQLLQIVDAISQIEDPAEKAAARMKFLGANSEDMARLTKKSLRAATDDVKAMSVETIAALDEMGKEWDGLGRKVSNFSRDMAVAMGFFLTGRDPESGLPDAHDFLFGVNPGNPNLPSSPNQHGLPPVRPPDAGGIDIIEQNIKASIAVNQLAAAQEEANKGMDEYQRKLGNVITFVPEFMAIADAQKLLAKGALQWADTLNNNVAAAVAKITEDLSDALQINNMLTKGVARDSAAIDARSSQDSDPFATDEQRRIDAINARHDRMMALVNQTDRESAAAAENTIWENTNRKIFGVQAQPSAGHVTYQTTNDFRGALFPDSGSMDALVRQIEQMMADRETARGGRVGR